MSRNDPPPLLRLPDAILYGVRGDNVGVLQVVGKVLQMRGRYNPLSWIILLVILAVVIFMLALAKAEATWVLP